MHISKQLRTSYMSRPGNANNWRMDDYLQVRIEGTKQIVWLRIQESDEKENQVQAIVVTNGRIQQVTITTEKTGIKATVEAVDKLQELGLLHEEDQEWMTKNTRNVLKAVGENENKKNHQTKKGEESRKE